MSREPLHYSRETIPSRVRCLIVWLSATGLCWAAGALCLEMALEAGRLIGPDVSLETFIILVGGISGVFSLGWLWAVASLSVAEALRGRITPGPPVGVGAVRRVVLLLCGVALSATATTPAQAASGSGSAGLDGLPYPDRAAISALDEREPVIPAYTAEPATPIGSPRHHEIATHVVRAGDTLWSIAADTLPDTAATEEIDARWREIHRTNQATVGDDPDLIRPGQVLDLTANDSDDNS